MNTIHDHRRPSLEWAILAEEGACKEDGHIPRTTWSGEPNHTFAPDPRVTLDVRDPRVGKAAFWPAGGTHTATVRAVILVDSVPSKLLLEDWTGFPWVRVALDAEIL